MPNYDIPGKKGKKKIKLANANSTLVICLLRDAVPECSRNFRKKIVVFNAHTVACTLPTKRWKSKRKEFGLVPYSDLRSNIQCCLNTINTLSYGKYVFTSKKLPLSKNIIFQTPKNSIPSGEKINIYLYVTSKNASNYTITSCPLYTLFTQRNGHRDSILLVALAAARFLPARCWYTAVLSRARLSLSRCL